MIGMLSMYHNNPKKSNREYCKYYAMIKLIRFLWVRLTEHFYVSNLLLINLDGFCFYKYYFTFDT